MSNTLNLVIPGDTITINEPIENSDITLGPNILLSNDQSTLLPSSSGIFINQKTNKNSSLFYIDSAHGRYIPQVGDLVIGTIIGQFGEYYKVSLNESSCVVLLNIFAFPNASKKNRPRLQIRDLIYARVSIAEKNIEAELSCIDAVTGKDGGFGVLNGGFCFNVSTAYSRFLLFSPNALILSKLVEKIKFEIAIGVNGKIWIKSDDSKSTMFCVYVISESENWKQSEINENFDKLVKQFKKL